MQHQVNQHRNRKLEESMTNHSVETFTTAATAGSKIPGARAPPDITAPEKDQNPDPVHESASSETDQGSPGEDDGVNNLKKWEETSIWDDAGVRAIGTREAERRWSQLFDRMNGIEDQFQGAPKPSSLTKILERGGNTESRRSAGTDLSMPEGRSHFTTGSSVAESDGIGVQGPPPSGIGKEGQGTSLGRDIEKPKPAVVHTAPSQ